MGNIESERKKEGEAPFLWESQEEGKKSQQLPPLELETFLELRITEM